MQVSPTDLAQAYSGKTDEELSSLHGQGTLTNTAYDVLETELRRRGLAIPQRPAPDLQVRAAAASYERASLMGHWRGKAPLASAYWLVGKLGSGIFYGIALLTRQFVPILTPVAGLAMLVFLVFAWVAIWRCWKNTTWPIWGYFARAEVIFYAVGVTAGVIRLISEAIEPRSVLP